MPAMPEMSMLDIQLLRAVLRGLIRRDEDGTWTTQLSPFRPLDWVLVMPEAAAILDQKLNDQVIVVDEVGNVTMHWGA